MCEQRKHQMKLPKTTKAQTKRETESNNKGRRERERERDLNNFVYNSLKVKCQIVYLSISPISGYIFANICIFAL